MPAMDAAGWDRRYSDAEMPLSLEPNRFVVELASDLDPGRALDLGAGWGRNALWLARRGWRVTAVDFSSVAIERMRGQAEASGLELDYVVADVCEYRPAAGGFDLVLVAFVHPEPAGRDALLARAAAAVARGGRLLVLGLDIAMQGSPRSPEPERRYTPARVARALSGIELERCESVSHEVQTSDGLRPTVETLAWGRRRALG